MHLKCIEDEGEEEAEEKEEDQGQKINPQIPDFQWSSAVPLQILYQEYICVLL